MYRLGFETTRITSRCEPRISRVKPEPPIFHVEGESNDAHPESNGIRCGKNQLMTFTRPCRYIHLFAPDSEPNIEVENKTDSLCSWSLQYSREDRKLSKYQH